MEIIGCLVWVMHLGGDQVSWVAPQVCASFCAFSLVGSDYDVE